MLVLEEMTIHHFRDMIPETKLQFSPKCNLILGKNAAGKTTLLNLIVFVLGGKSEVRDDEEIDMSYVLVDHDIRISTKFSRRIQHTHTHIPKYDSPYPHLNPDITIQNDTIFTYHVDIDTKGEQIKIRNKNNEITIEHPSNSIPHQFTVTTIAPYLLYFIFDALFRRTGIWAPAPILLHLPYFYERVIRFDEGDHFYQNLLSSQAASKIDIIHEPNGFGYFVPVFVGATTKWALTEICQRSPSPHALQDKLVLPAARVGFLKAFIDITGFEDAQMRFLVSDINTNAKNVTTISINRFEFLFTIDKYRTIDASKLSFGQKRLLAFLYASYVETLDGKDITEKTPIVADELTNGFHHEWIEKCMEILQSRQSFVATQNPLLLDYLEFNDATELQRTFTFCYREKTDEGSKLSMRGPTKEEAENMFSSYQVGFQHVSEILRMSGLW